MGGVRWQDGRSSSEVAEMCGVEDLFVELSKRRFEMVRTHEKGRGRGVERGGGGEDWRLRKCDGGYEFVGNRRT